MRLRSSLAQHRIARPRHWLVLAVLVALARRPTAAAAPTPPRPSGLVTAARATTALHIDGVLDEAAWAAAPPYETFVQDFPNEGAAPSERTTLRVLYDDEFLYVAFHCHDTRPAEISWALGNRDDPPPTDGVEISVDFAHDHRTAYRFGVTAGGTQFDTLLYADSHETGDWDGVWDAATSIRPDGWSAEMAIPLHIFRISGQGDQIWGFHARRWLPRTHEEISSMLLPHGAAGHVSLFGHLLGVGALGSRRHLELLPYAAGRFVERPQFSDAAQPHPRLSDATFDFGLDARLGITDKLQLNLTVNPDFGQVEADQIILNLSNQEAFFPEKRPFFFQGTEVFQPITSGRDDPPEQRLFYSRRIGLDTPILGAAKLTGEVGSRWQVGLLEALVTSPGGLGGSEATPDRSLRFHPTRPLHLGPEDEVAHALAVNENYLAGVLQYKLGETSTVGARVSSGVPWDAPPCSAADTKLDVDSQPPGCSVRGGNAAALDWNLRSRDAVWGLLGQVEGSETVGGPPQRTLPDGVGLARGERGYGGFVQAGKMGGAPWRFDATYSYLSPTLDLNAVGFLPTQNLQTALGSIVYVRPTGFGSLHSFSAELAGHASFSTDGRGLDRGQHVHVGTNTIFSGFHNAGFELGFEPSHFDPREITGSGIPVERPGVGYLAVWGQTDPNRPFSLEGSAALGQHGGTPISPSHHGWTFEATGIARPWPRLDSRLSLQIDRTPQGPRWTGAQLADAAGLPGDYLLGDLQTEYLSVTFRQRVILFPRLTIQGYAQLFSDYGHYARFFQADGADKIIRLGDLRPTAASHPGFHDVALNLSVVLRWEYRLGSTFYAVYTHASASRPLPDGVEAPATLSPRGLFAGPAVDGFMMKWSYWWDL